ncbi:MAG: hypothetical protein QOD57_3107 [Actinomycetota bacterium]|nr:hypothetical protein [Actinomycetota bacterium]MDQ1498145.1 hypothetical protein [Actinomycetota bacterium]MDQ1505380.1 hypothetical protein [Actinomycetota bacterium]MDQ1568812.1 hypothetical protein [Actinomycetota bacterium]
MGGMTWLRAEWDRFLAWGLLVVGAVLLMVGAVQVADHRYLADQLSLIMSAGIGGLGCIGFGAGLILSADLHDEWRKLDRLEERLVEVPDRAAVFAVDLEPQPLDEPTTPSLQAVGNGRGRGRG